MSPVDQRHTLTHELAHCHLFALVESAAVFDGFLPGDLGEAAAAMRVVEVERAVDGLADGLAPSLPLPYFAPAQ